VVHDHIEKATSYRQSPVLKVAYPLILLALGTLAYINSFTAPFIFDNIYDIAENVSIRRLWPPWLSMFARANISRPLIGLSLAINYAISGLNPWSYHVLNLLIHLGAGLTLMGIVRRTLLTPKLAERFADKSGVLAFSVAAVWLTHPIQTAAITNVIQRCESLMGLFYLLTLYLFIRGATTARSVYWYAAAVAACVAGMLCKQVMVTAPIVVFLYDVVLLSTSAGKAISRRWRFYSALALAWIPLAAFAIAAPHNETAGFGVSAIGPLSYLRSELEVVCYYIRLSFWPNSLCLDYSWPVGVTLWHVLPYGFLLVILVIATVWALLKRAPIAFIGIWFFGILSVTSTFMPFTDLAFDHRMYLPLAAISALVILGGYRLLDGLANLPSISEPLKQAARVAFVTLTAGVVASLVFATLRRNVDYQFPIAMWSDVIKQSPNNPRAHGSLGMHLIEAGRLEEAIAELNEAIELKPGYVGAEAYLGRALVLQGRDEEAVPHLLFVLRNNPNHSAAHLYLGRVLLTRGQLPEATDHLRRAVALEPTYAEAHYFLGLALSKEGRPSEAQTEYAITDQLWPGLVEQLTSGQSNSPSNQ